MIVSFGDKGTEDQFHNRATRRARRYPQDILRSATQKLDMVNAARQLRDLRSPPGNRLELHKGDLKEYHSIRINSQWRIIFRWDSSDALSVQVGDYHRG